MLNVDDALATHNKKNKAKQSIDQSQSSNQNSQVVSGADTIGSGNNINVQINRILEATQLPSSRSMSETSYFL